jgi:SAM-dependent methyltransferase
MTGNGVSGPLDALASTAGLVEGYGWGPLPLYDFLQGMSIAGPGAGRRFLDAGSGIGEKLELAAMLGWKPTGVEREPEYVCSSRLYWPHPVIVGDAFEFAEYADFDLVYCYRPCFEAADQDALNRVIAERMRPGALFFSAGGPWPDWLEHVGGQVWVTR